MYLIHIEALDPHIVGQPNISIAPLHGTPVTQADLSVLLVRREIPDRLGHALVVQKFVERDVRLTRLNLDHLDLVVVAITDGLTLEGDEHEAAIPGQIQHGKGANVTRHVY